MPLGLRPCRLRGSHPLRPAIPGRSATGSGPNRGPTTPGGASPPGLGWSAFARRYSRNRGFFLLLRVLRCFSSPGSLGHSGINARLTAPPDLSQSPTPFCLPAPRHPPRALSSLATPLRPLPPAPPRPEKGPGAASYPAPPAGGPSPPPPGRRFARSPPRPHSKDPSRAATAGRLTPEAHAPKATRPAPPPQCDSCPPSCQRPRNPARPCLGRAPTLRSEKSLVG